MALVLDRSERMILLAEAENTNMNIYQKLAKIRKPVEVLKKNRKAYNYSYVTEDEILAKITGLMEKYSISLIPQIVPGTTEMMPYTYTNTKAMKDGTIYEQKTSEILVKSDMEWHWVNNDNPDDRIVVPWALVGQQADASQAFGSGLSYCTRYFMLKYFNVATSDEDPDNWRSKQKEAKETENKIIADGITEQIMEIINNHLSNHAEDRDAIVTIVKKYAKDKGKASPNPKVIRDPVLASKLLEEIKAKCGNDIAA